MKKQLTASLVIAAGLAVLASGCSSDAPAPKPTEKPTASATAPEVTYNECVDGKATVLASAAERDGSIELGDCAEVSVVGAATKGSTVQLGTVTLLVVEADSANIRAGAVERIVVPGSHNTIAHTGDAAVDDQGTDNTITGG